MQNDPQSNSNSPLTQANPQSLDELFSRDPLDLSDEDIGTIVKGLRQQRAAWLLAESQGKRSAPKTPSSPKGPKTKPERTVAVDLSDLGL